MSAAGRAPAMRATSRPPAKTASVGMDWTPRRWPRSASSDFFQLRRDHPTGAAPRRPEIDDDGNRRASNELIEIGRLSDFDRRGRRRERLLALAAADHIAQPFVREAILLSAGCARGNYAAIVGKV